MDRRSFIKIGGGVAAAGVTGSCGQMTQKIIPYVTPADEGINPVNGTFYNTTCRVCPAGCGVTVRTVLGRAKKVEGNPAHPINRGGVCARGQAAVEQVYHPERIKTPLLRSGAKGTNAFKPVTWEEALKLLGENVKGATGGAAYAIAGDSTDITAGIAARLVKQLGSDDFAVPDINGTAARARAAAAHGPVPVYDLASAGCVLLLGADIFEEGSAPVHYSWAYGQMRRGSAIRRGMMLYAGPRVSMTAVSADHFFAVRKGQLGFFALGVAYEVVALALAEGKLSESAAAAYKAALVPYNAEHVSHLTGATAENIRKVAEELLTHAPAVAVAGDEVYLQTNGAAALEAVELLNAVLKSVKGGKSLLHAPAGDDAAVHKRMREFIGVPDKATDYATLQKALAGAADGKKKLGLILNANPVHELPAALNVAGALGKTGFVAVFGCFLNDTTRYADLVLPDSHFLESWSVQLPGVVPGSPVLNAQQPVIMPLYGTVQAGDALLKAAVLAGINLGAASQEALIAKMLETFRKDLKGVPATLSAKAAWEHLLARGGWWPVAEHGGQGGHEAEKHAAEPKPSVKKVNIEKPAFAGGAEHTFHLHPYHTVMHGNGATANSGWLMEMPEPMTTLSWGAWIEINKKTAQGLGIADGDILKVDSPFGSIEATAYLYPGIDPETVAVPFGFGHESYGKHASKRGFNAMTLIGDHPVRGAGLPAWRGIKVKLTKTGKNITMVREGNARGDYEGEVFQL